MQTGHLYRTDTAWHVRFREVAGGKRVQRSQSLGPRSLKRAEARRLADEYLQRVVGQTGTNPGITLREFVETQYLPYVVTEMQPSTAAAYADLWRLYGDRISERTRLRDWRTVDGEHWLRRIASERELTSTTLRHIKAFLSGVFTFALRLGVVTGGNPMTSVSIPRGKRPTATHAYTPAEVDHLLSRLVGVARAAVAVAAYSGLRKSEIMGLRWEDYQNGVLRVERKVWEGIVGETKSAASRGLVPVVPALAQELVSWALLARSPNGWMFEGETGRPLDLHNLAVRKILPIVGKDWHGWHSFRRGLGSQLFADGISDIMVARILRHAEVSVTRKHYIKVCAEQVAAAMITIGAPHEKISSEENSDDLVR